jgi:hypothetical protein
LNSTFSVSECSYAEIRREPKDITLELLLGLRNKAKLFRPLDSIGGTVKSLIIVLVILL